MKRIIFILAFAIVMACTAMSQITPLPSPFYTGITIGAKSVPNRLNITKITVSGSKASVYSGGTMIGFVNPDTTSAKGLFVEVSDSNYRNPGSYVPQYQFKTKYAGMDLQKAYKGINPMIKAFPLCPLVFSGGQALNSAYIYGCLTVLADTTPATGIKYVQHTMGAYTAGAYNGVGLYEVDIATATYTLVASSANTPNAWTNPTNTFTGIPFTAVYNAPPGYYMMVELYTQTAQGTQPLLTIANTFLYSFNDILGGTINIAWFLAGQTSLPASIPAASTTHTSNVLGLMLY